MEILEFSLALAAEVENIFTMKTVKRIAFAGSAVKQLTGERRAASFMPIKNHTTKIDVYTSLGEIQGALARNGACKIMVDYGGNGMPTGVAFALNTADGPRGFVLPANVDGVAEVFRRQKVKADQEQARRTAWRNIRDWVLAQVAFIESGNVQAEEVFLPYLTDGRGHTLYQAYKSGQLSLPQYCDGNA